MFFRKPAYWKFAATFAIGSIAGAAAALFFAPMTGKKFQRKVADVTEKVIARVDDLQQSVRKLASA